jgi:CDP-paratose 2-epimerase
MRHGLRPTEPANAVEQRQLGILQWLRPGEHDRIPTLIQQMKSIDARRLRTGISWADYHAPGGREWYAWVLPVLAEHFELLPCFHYTPPSLGVVERSSAPPREPKAYADFLDMIVSEHGAHFDWVELWNEPTNLLDWDWRLDPDWNIFSAMVGGAAYWMHQRGKRVVLGGNCPTDLNWLRRLADLGVLAHVDAIGVHAFPGTWSIDWAGWDAEIGVLRACLRDIGADLAIWVTEAGFSTWRHDEAQQARELLQAMRADADRLYWYSLQDLTAEDTTQQGFHVDERHYHMGLFHEDGTPKLAARCLARGGPAKLAAVTDIASPHLLSSRPRVVITGGAGFLGSNIANRLAEAGDDVLIIDSLARERADENLAWLRSKHRFRIAAELADVRDRHAVSDALAGARAVIHLAAQVAVTTSLADPFNDFETNARGTLNVLEAVRRRAPETPILFASTNKVYGELITRDRLDCDNVAYRPKDSALAAGFDESTPLSFYSPYGCSKGVADQYVLDFARVFGLRTAVLRMSCLYGPRQFGTEDQGWVAHFLISALTGKPITIYGDGRQVRDVLYVDDAVAAYRAVLGSIDRVSGRAFNLGGGPLQALSLRQLLAMLPQVAGVEPEVRFSSWRPGDQAWYVSNTSALGEATGWQPKVSVRDGLVRLASWLETAFPREAPRVREMLA